MDHSQYWTPHQPPPAKKSFAARFFRFLYKSILYFLIASVGAVVLYRFVPVYVTPLMIWRSAEALVVGESVSMSKTWVPIQQINKSMQRAVIKAEDYRFYEHSGFDWDAIEKAMKYNKTHKRKKGASTISQQTAKNVFLWPSRSWLRKGLEAYFTVLIEFAWPKERILEVYLNVIELGSGVYGVEAASQKFFKKSAKGLSNAQASLMAAVLPNPRRFRIDRPSAYVLRRQSKIMSRSSVGIPVVTEGAADSVASKTTLKPNTDGPKAESAKVDSVDSVESSGAADEQSLRDYIDLKLDSDPTEPDTEQDDSL